MNYEHLWVDTSGLSGQMLQDTIQSNFAAIEKAKAAAAAGNSEDSSANSSFNSNKLRGSIFDTVAKGMQPDKKYIEQYKELLRSAYVARAKKELKIEAKKSVRAYRTRTDRPTYTGAGWARGDSKGGLYRHFNAEVIVKIKKQKKGTMEIKYEVRPDFKDTPWGVGLAKDRSPQVVEIKSIMGWIGQKMKNKTFVIGKKQVKGIKRGGGKPEDKEEKIGKLILGIAIAIQKTMAKVSKPPVLKDWYMLDKNKRLSIGFRKDVDKKGAYYRTQIRRSIIRNINAQN
tara:strand:- start:10577 stop:11431 length:855 start_codon:yes stop_codon:yes gene_type:complete